MKKQKLAILAQLNDCGGDISKQWFIFFSYYNSKSLKMERFRDYKGFVALKNPQDRYELAKKRIAEINTKLMNGWNPTENSLVIYHDELIFKNEQAALKGKKRISNVSFGFYINKYLERLKPDVRPATYTTYKSKFRVFNQFLARTNKTGIDITAFGKQDADKFIDYLKNDRKVKGSVNMYIELMRRLYDFMIDNKAVRNNLFTEIKKVKKMQVPPQYIGVEALQLFKEEAKKNDPQMWLVFRFIFYLFIRPKELRYLKIENLHLDEGFVHIPAEISKTKETRYPTIPEVFLQELIEEGFSNMPKEFYIITNEGVPGDKNKPVSKNFMWNRFSAIRQALNLPKSYKFYAFKHTGMAMARNSGVDTKDIQMQAGHHSLDMVDKYLKQLTPVQSTALRFKGPSI